MFKRLLVLVLLAIATVFVSTPARAATLSLSGPWCTRDDARFYACSGSAYGGTGTYTSYAWTVRSPTGSTNYYYLDDESELLLYCPRGGLYTITLRVTDSAGATASGQTTYRCIV